MLTSHRTQILLSAAPLFLFGVLLWWYAGRPVDELSRPLFRSKADPATAARVDARNFFWLGVCLVSGFFGMGTIIVGATFAWWAVDLKRAMPEFFAKLEQDMPLVQNLEAAPAPLLLAGFLLVVIAGLALVLAMRRQAPAR